MLSLRLGPRIHKFCRWPWARYWVKKTETYQNSAFHWLSTVSIIWTRTTLFWRITVHLTLMLLTISYQTLTSNKDRWLSLYTSESKVSWNLMFILFRTTAIKFTVPITVFLFNPLWPNKSLATFPLYCLSASIPGNELADDLRLIFNELYQLA